LHISRITDLDGVLITSKHRSVPDLKREREIGHDINETDGDEDIEYDCGTNDDDQDNDD